ncbi:MAG: hypothetical protein AMJ46_12465 [Latescibacteria bacterium DG_63]|nr:MAG: hypothetical protein AMJ46_12465 [Latescibacteria bacterium DG_63]
MTRQELFKLQSDIAVLLTAISADNELSRANNGLIRPRIAVVSLRVNKLLSWLSQNPEAVKELEWGCE